MTPKQSQRLQKEIVAIKRTLAAEKRKFGGYEDSRGLRYIPPRYYLQVGDYKGGLTYTRWFAKTFPDDIGMPDFLFEWAILLFKTGHVALAQGKIWQTFCANTYLLDKFFNRPIQALPKYEWSNLAQADFTAYFTYSHQQADLLHFSGWLADFMASEPFSARAAHYLRLQHQLVVEEDEETRTYLHQETDQLENQLNF